MNLSLDTPALEIPALADCPIQKGSKVLITGASGFVGSRLAEVLSIQLGCEVYAMVRDYSRAVKLSHLPIHFLYGDLRNDQWKNQLPVTIDFVFHCAYGSSGSSQERRQTDLTGTKNLLHALTHRSLKKFIFLSTVSVFEQKKQGVIDETGNLKPVDNYGKNKLSVEKLLAEECPKLKICYSVFRPSAILGPGAPSYVNRIIREIQAHEIVFLNEGKGRLNWIYVDDVVSAMIVSASITKSDSQTYVLSHPQSLTYFEYYQALATSIGETLHYRFLDRQENRRILKTQKATFIQIIKSSIDLKKLRPLMQFPVLSGLLGLLNKIRKLIVRPKSKLVQPFKIENPRTLLPVSEEYADFLLSEVAFQSRHLISDQLLRGYTGFEEVMHRIKRNNEWESSWRD